MYDLDLFVIGAGSGGVRASRIAAQFGARVAVAEDMFIGGTCVNVGCVPKKLMVYGSHFREDFEDAAAFGWDVTVGRPDWGRLIANKDKEIARLNDVYRGILSRAGVELIEGRAVIVDPHTVEVNGRRISARYILVAVGGWPYLPQIPGIEHAITSNEIFRMKRLPERIAVVGGGFIAVEFAGIFNGYGAQVTQIYRGDKVLRGFDEDVRATLSEEIVKKGIDLRLSRNVTAIERLADDSLSVTLDDGGTLQVDALVYATGRRPKTAALGLEEAGVAMDEKGAVIVDEYSRTNVDSIYAIGDVTDRINLTPVALMEGMAFAKTVFGGQPTPVDHDMVPSAVFSQPPVATVGLSEEQARARYADVDIYRSTFRPLKHTLTGRDERVMMKLVVDADSDRVLGAHMVDADAAEIIQGIAIAVKMGATKAQFDATIGIHPTAAEEFVTMREKAS